MATYRLALLLAATMNSAMKASLFGLLLVTLSLNTEARKSKSSGRRDPVTLGLAPRDDYCSVSRNHTVCLYAGIDNSKCQKVLQRGIPKLYERKIVELHNTWRRQIASGEFGQPQAANMLKMEWDPEAAAIAQRLADQCEFKSDMRRDTVKSKDGAVRNGQNIYMQWTHVAQASENRPEPLNTILSWGEKMGKMISSAKNFSRSEIDSFKDTDPQMREYSQLAWAQTSKVGCGFIKHIATKDKERNLFDFLVCNYGPSGNFKGQPIYKVGLPCSACPEKRASCDNSLCSKGPRTGAIKKLINKLRPSKANKKKGKTTTTTTPKPEDTDSAKNATRKDILRNDTGTLNLTTDGKSKVNGTTIQEKVGTNVTTDQQQGKNTTGNGTKTAITGKPDGFHNMIVEPPVPKAGNKTAEQTQNPPPPTARNQTAPDADKRSAPGGQAAQNQAKAGTPGQKAPRSLVIRRQRLIQDP